MFKPNLPQSKISQIAKVIGEWLLDNLGGSQLRQAYYDAELPVWETFEMLFPGTYTNELSENAINDQVYEYLDGKIPLE